MSVLTVLLAVAVAAAPAVGAPSETQRLAQAGLTPIAEAVKAEEQVIRVSIDAQDATPNFKPFAVSLLFEKQGFGTIDLTSNQSPHLISTPVPPSYWPYFAKKRDAALSDPALATAAPPTPNGTRMTIEVTQAKGAPVRAMVTSGAPPPALAAVTDELLEAAASVSPCATRGAAPAIERLLACYTEGPTVSANAN